MKNIIGILLVLFDVHTGQSVFAKDNHEGLMIFTCKEGTNPMMSGFRMLGGISNRADDPTRGRIEPYLGAESAGYEFSAGVEFLSRTSHQVIVGFGGDWDIHNKKTGAGFATPTMIIVDRVQNTAELFIGKWGTWDENDFSDALELGNPLNYYFKNSTSLGRGNNCTINYNALRDLSVRGPTGNADR